MPRSAGATLIQLLIIALVAVPTPAQAAPGYDGIVPTGNYDFACVDSSGPTDASARVCQTDNADVYWYADSADPGELESNDQDALRSMLADEYSPTDLAIHYDSSPVFSGDAETDLIYQEAEAAMPLPSGLVGFTWCNGAAAPFYECDQTYIRIDSPDGYRIFGGSIACHETGHGVGLVHGNDASPAINPSSAQLGCMVNGDDFPSALGANNAYFINNTY